MARDLIEHYLDRIVAHDWDAVGACLAEDVVRIGPYGDVYTPRDTYVRFLAGLMPTLEGYAMRIDRVVMAGSVAFAELTETVEVDGSPLQTPEALVFELDDRDLITAIRIYIQRPAS